MKLSQNQILPLILVTSKASLDVRETGFLRLWSVLVHFSFNLYTTYLASTIFKKLAHYVLLHISQELKGL